MNGRIQPSVEAQEGISPVVNICANDPRGPSALSVGH